ncbi:hypothetical protein FD29_GL000578 [Companilactobacillus mindensis DSM 14500]|uniref:DUF3862 domain-containing protein n=2 Tax=Companilactobacillus mindensis TaxID=167481 RepID=A0A0R1QVG1_9LACO|nr:hypothetical protein FD29_GL000578 [Companilactobacillus mindensis DSM 14500]
MKMTNENERKPFYRRNWFWITILSIFIVVSATTYVANYAFYPDKVDKATVKQTKNVTSKKIENNPSLVAKYNSIKTGQKGLSKAAVIDLLGQPATSQSLPNSSILNLTWDGTDNGENVTIQITFEKGKATAKSIQGLNIDRKRLLTLKDFEKLQVGDEYNRVIDVLGDPDTYSDTNGIKILTYESDLAEADLSQDATIKIEISDNKIINLEQQNLK